MAKLKLDKAIGGRDAAIQFRCTKEFKVKAKYYAAKYFQADVTKMIRILIEQEFSKSMYFENEWERVKPKYLSYYDDSSTERKG